MSCLPRRSPAYFSTAFLGLFLAVLFWTSCGGTSQSSSSTPSATNNPPATGAQPGGSGTGGTGGTSGGAGGTGSSGSGSSGATYLYVSFASDAARVGSYKVDVSGASLTAVPGSPFNEQGGTTPGVLTVSKNFLYGSEAHISSTSSSSSSATITAFRPDPSSGSLTQAGTLTLPNNTQIALFPEPSGHNLYAIDSFGNILTLIINSDGTLTNTGSSLHLADGVGSLAVSPNGRLAYATISNGSFKAGTLTDAMVVLNRDPSSGTLSMNHQINSNQHLFDLQFDTSGRYLLAVSGGSDHISVYSVNESTGDVTPVPGSPFLAVRPQQSPSGDFARTFGLDPSGKFVYVLNANPADPKPEYVSVFSFSDATGALAPVQAFDMNPGTTPVSLVTDQSLVFAVNTNSGFNPSNINVFRRDATTGMLSAGGSPVTAPAALGASAEVHF